MSDTREESYGASGSGTPGMGNGGESGNARRGGGPESDASVNAGKKAPEESARDSRQENHQMQSLLEESKKAVVGGTLAFLVLFIGTFSVGEISGAEARDLLTSMLPTARFLYSAVVTASATVLALMLTLLSLSFNTQSRLDASHYQRIRRIALIDTVTFITAMSFLLFLIVPLDEPQSIVPSWYEVFYYTTVVGSAVLGGLLVTIVLMLYSTVTDMIRIFGLRDEDHPLVAENGG